MTSETASGAEPELDVVIVGAGLSGIGAACHLRRECPDLSFALLEARDGLGGTWDLFRYPGVRSDSDMHTLGYGFKPWTSDRAIAGGEEILAYLRETAEEYQLSAHIRLGHAVRHAAWSSERARWTLTVDDEGRTRSVCCRFLLVCAGYYRYRAGYDPEFLGRAEFQGTIVHPQHWPEDLDYRDQRVVVIGSGATAVTLVPALAEQAAHVTMLQRSPTYVVSRASIDGLQRRLQRWLPDHLAHLITRAKNVFFTAKVYERTRKDPDKVRRWLLAGVREELGPRYDVQRHFTPRYDPWDQRLCLVPDGDLFESIRQGKVEVVTEGIERFTATGVRLANGEHLEADLIVTATGLELAQLGEIEIEVDGEPVDFAARWTYKGFGYSGVPNLFSIFGYINASWTLRSDLISRYACRVLRHMQRIGASYCVPTLRPEDADMSPRPYVEQFSSGYMQRGLHRLPRQGDHDPWTNPQNYLAERKRIRRAAIDDGVLQFHRAPVDGSGACTRRGAISPWR